MAWGLRRNFLEEAHLMTVLEMGALPWWNEAGCN